MMKRKYNVAKKSLRDWQALADKIISKRFSLGLNLFLPKRRVPAKGHSESEPLVFLLHTPLLDSKGTRRVPAPVPRDWCPRGFPHPKEQGQGTLLALGRGGWRKVGGRVAGEPQEAGRGAGWGDRGLWVGERMFSLRV